MPMAVQKTDNKKDNVPQEIIVKKKKKTIYLTFDDGPDSGTKIVYNILKQEKIPATMFIVGEHVYGSRTQRNMYDSLKNCNYFELANHSYSHAFKNNFNKFYSDPDSAVHDFARCAEILGFNSNIIRTPGRNIWRTENIHSTDIKSSTTTADSIYNKGFTAVGWDVEWNYNKAQTLLQSDSEMIAIIDSAFAKQHTKTANHLVLLAHDRTFKTTDDSASLHHFILKLKKKEEYNFAVISLYPGLVNDSLNSK